MSLAKEIEEAIKRDKCRKRIKFLRKKGYTFAQIGRDPQVNLTRERVRQIVKKGEDV